MIELSAEEKEELMTISKKFVNVHMSIAKTEENMKKITKSASLLISKLEKCRSREIEFMNELNKKYGEGILDPMTLSWEASK
jgi:hypothetical protein